MMNLQHSIEQQVSIFVRSVSELVREAAIEALQQAIVVPGLGDAGKTSKRRQKQGKPGKGYKRSRGKPSSQRDEAELAALTERLYQAIESQPGKRMEDLAPTVGSSAGQLRASIDKLMACGRVSKAGQRRSTRYFPMDSDKS